MFSLLAFAAGFVLDLILGDPIGWPHVVLGYGRLIGFLERTLRGAFPKTPAGEIAAGACMVFLVCAASLGGGIALLYLCGLVSPYLRLFVESVLVWQCLSMRSLKVASLEVYRPLAEGDLPAARKAVGEIVGRDTGVLDERGVARAAVETVAENTSDGVIAPLFYMAIGGAPLGLLYKAINTMDSMVGYKNEKYLYFGRVAARLDDMAGFFPARLAGLTMVLAARLVGLDGKSAFKIFRRDRLNHASPNSAHTEAACAGALGVMLGGDSVYFGRVVSKPTIGDGLRQLEAGDILRANRLMYASAFLFFILCAIAKGVALWL